MLLIDEITLVWFLYNQYMYKDDQVNPYLQYCDQNRAGVFTMLFSFPLCVYMQENCWNIEHYFFDESLYGFNSW